MIPKIPKKILDLKAKKGMKYVMFKENPMDNQWRIMACKNFGTVKKGDVGGYVHSKKTLSHDGLCWIHDHAVVMNHSKIIEDAQVYGKANVTYYSTVKGRARVGDNAFVTKSCISDDAQVIGNSCIIASKGSGSAIVADDVKVIHSDVGGDAVVCCKSFLLKTKVMTGTVIDDILGDEE